MIDAARIREVLEPFQRKADAVSLSSALGHIERQHLHDARALLRNLDAQGLAPAGWREVGTVLEDGVFWNKESTRNWPSSGTKLYALDDAAPALHAPTVEACEWEQIDAERVLYVDRGKETILCDRNGGPVTILVKRRALTRGDEAASDQAERLLFAAHGDPARVFETTEELMNYLDEPDSDRGASAERPLSEWSDDELFRAIQKLSTGSNEALELRSRGWLPWYGGDKAPVEGEVEVRLRDGLTLGLLRQAVPTRYGVNLIWKHRDSLADIIAYRPVPAKAEPATDAGADENEPKFTASMTGTRTLTAGPNELRIVSPTGETVAVIPPFESFTLATDAGEVERLAEIIRGVRRAWPLANGPYLDSLDASLIARAILASAEAQPGERG